MLPLLTLAAVSLPAPALRAQGETFDGLLREAKQRWEAKDLATARQLAERASKLDDDRWEGHHLLAQILLEMGVAAEARQSGKDARDRLRSHMTKLDTFDSRRREQAERLRDEAKAALAENDTARAREKVTQARHLAPEVEGLAEIIQQLPPSDRKLVMDVTDAAASKGGTRGYVANRGRVVNDKAEYDKRLQAARANKDRQELAALMNALDLGTRSPGLDATRNSLESGDLEGAADSLRAELDSIVSNDPDVQSRNAEEAFAAGKLDLVVENLRPLANNRFYAPVVLRLAKQVARTAPDRMAPILLRIRDLNVPDSAEAEQQLEEIYRSDARRVEPNLPQITAAARAGDGQRLFDLLAKYEPPIADPDFRDAGRLLQEGRSVDALKQLTAVVERLERLVGPGPVPVVRAEAGKRWTTSNGTPMRYVAAQQWTAGGRPVSVEKHFWIAERRVTRKEYLELMGKEPLWDVAAAQTESSDMPVDDNVTYRRAVTFCEILTSRDQAAGLIPPGYRYSLPTEAEHELAMRAVPGTPDTGMDWCLTDGKVLPYRTAAGQRSYWKNPTNIAPGVSFRLALAPRGD
ncbi:MAG: hypothetical protein WAT39_04055 [Planctomycetota bacterium]